MAEEATINPDGTQDMPPVEDPTADAGGEEIPIIDEETQEKIEEVIKGVDPAIYLIVVAVIVLGTMFYLATRKKDGDDFFDDLDGDKVRTRIHVIAIAVLHVHLFDLRRLCRTVAGFHSSTLQRANAPPLG